MLSSLPGVCMTHVCLRRLGSQDLRKGISKHLLKILLKHLSCHFKGRLKILSQAWGGKRGQANKGIPILNLTLSIS
jgi:hypothetical protein